MGNFYCGVVGGLFVKWIELSLHPTVRLLTLELVDIPRITAEREGIRRIFTVDRNDFTLYRLHGRIGLAIVP